MEEADVGVVAIYQFHASIKKKLGLYYTKSSLLPKVVNWKIRRVMLEFDFVILGVPVPCMFK